jgi:hypothetical protein
MSSGIKVVPDRPPPPSRARVCAKRPRVMPTPELPLCHSGRHVELLQLPIPATLPSPSPPLGCFGTPEPSRCRSGCPPRRRPMSQQPAPPCRSPAAISAPKPHTSRSLTNPRSFLAPSPAKTVGKAARFWPAAPPLGPGDHIARYQELLRVWTQIKGMAVRL